MAHGHRQRRVRALLHGDPEVGELRGFRIVGADDHRLGAAIARLGIEVGVRRARLRHVRAPEDEEARIVPVGRFRHVGLLAPGLRRCRRQVAVPVVEGHTDAAEQRQVARAGRIGDHRHGRDRREAVDSVRAVGLGGIGIGRRDDLVGLVPAGADEAAMAALRGVARPLLRVLDDGGPGRHRCHGGARFPPQLGESRTDHRVLHPVAGVEIPGIGGAARTAAGLMVRQLRPRARIVGLLRLPGDDPALNVDLPGAGAGAVGAVGGADDLVRLPAPPVAVLPAAVLGGGDPVTAGELAGGPVEKGQAIEKMRHGRVPEVTGRAGGRGRRAGVRRRGGRRPCACRPPR